MANKELIEAQKEILASTFSQAQAYTNLIIAAGYAGFFGIWSFVKDDLTRGTMFWSALLISLSLAAFIAFEIYGMYYRSVTLIGIANALDDAERFESLILRHRAEEKERAIVFGRLWLGVLSFTVVTGFLALFILLSAFIHGIWMIYMT